MLTIHGWSVAAAEIYVRTLALLLRHAWRLIANALYAAIVRAETPSVEDADVILQEWAKQLQSATIMHYVFRALRAAATHARAQVGASDSLDVFDSDAGEDVLARHYAEFTRRMQYVGSDMWTSAREQIASSAREGVSAQQIAEQVRDTLELTLPRAQSIARTEIHSAHNAGAFAQTVYLDPNATKTWKSRLDDRTRATHLAAHDQTVAIGETFVVGGSPLRYPGDLLGPIGEVINCRCETTYQLGLTRDEIADMEPNELNERVDIVAATSRRKWNPLLHPRGNDGRFIEKGLLFDILTGDWKKHSSSTLSGYLTKIPKKDWDNLTTKQQQTVVNMMKEHAASLRKAAKKSKAQTKSTSKTKPTTPTAKSSVTPTDSTDKQPAKVSTKLIWGKHDANITLLESEDGVTRIHWDGKNFQRQTQDEDGNWATDTTWPSKKAAYEALKGSDSWFTPTTSSDAVETTPSAPPEAPQTAPSTETVQEISAPDMPDVSQVADLSTWTKVGGQLGSNAGGTYAGPDGERAYVKQAKTEKHAANEVLASMLYNLAGVATPQVFRGENAPGLGSGTQTYAAIVPDASSDFGQKLQNPSYLAKVREGFAVDAWLANWDVAGLTFDNVVSDANGDPIRIDVGGTLLFRAQGGLKGAAFGDEVTELDTLRDPGMNPQASQVFGGMLTSARRESAKRLLAITPEQIDQAVTAAGFAGTEATDLAQRLKNRRDYILNTFNIVDEPTPTITQPDPIIPETAQLTQTPVSAVHVGKAPGEPLKITTGLIWGKYDADTVIAESADGQRRVRWDGKKYQLEQRQSDGSWATQQSLTKKDTYATLKGDTSWTTPGSTDDVIDAPEAVESASDVPDTPETPETTSPAASQTPSVTAPPELNTSDVDYEVGDEFSWYDAVHTDTGYVNDDIIAVSSDGQWHLTWKAGQPGTFGPQIIVSKKNDNGVWANDFSFDLDDLAGVSDIDEYVSYVLGGDFTAHTWLDAQSGAGAGLLNINGFTTVPNAQADNVISAGDWDTVLQKDYAVNDIIAVAFDVGESLRIVQGKQNFIIQWWYPNTNSWELIDAHPKIGFSKYLSDHYGHQWNLPEGVTLDSIKASTPVSTPTTSPPPVTLSGPDWLVENPTNTPDGEMPNWFGISLNWPKLTPGQILGTNTQGNLAIPIRAIHTDYGNVELQEFYDDTWATLASTPASKLTSEIVEWQDDFGIKTSTWKSAQRADPLTTGPTPTPATPPVATSPIDSANVVDTSSILKSTKDTWKKTLSANKVGYWSKPDKIWTAVSEIHASSPQFSPLQIIKSLDDVTNTKDPSPFETKITKWAQTAAGSNAVKNSLSINNSGAPTISSTPKFVGFASAADVADIDFAATVQENSKLDPKDIWSAVVNNAPDTGSVIVAIGLSPDKKTEWFISSGKSSVDGKVAAFLLSRDVGSASSKWVGHGLLYDESDMYNTVPNLTWVSGQNAVKKSVPSSSATKPTVSPASSSPAKIVNGVVDVGAGDIESISEPVKNAAYTEFKNAAGTYLSNDGYSIWDAAQTIANRHNLSILQVLRIVDAVGAQRSYIPNGHLFETKIINWLKTPKGVAQATGQPVPLPPTPKLFPGVGQQIMSFEESSKLSYDNISLSSAEQFWNESIAKYGKLTSRQREAVNAYTGGIFSSLNAYLYAHDEISTVKKTTINNIQKAMRPSTQPMLLVRGTSLDQFAHVGENVREITGKIGTTFKNSAFMSTTIDTSPSYYDTPVQLRIEAPPGTPMVWARPISQFPNENEMLLAAGLNLKLINVTSDDYGTTIIHVRVVP